MFTLSFSLVFPSSELEDRPQTQVREHLDLGHNNNTHFLVNYAVAPAISTRTRTRGSLLSISACAR